MPPVRGRAQGDSYIEIPILVITQYSNFRNNYYLQGEVRESSGRRREKEIKGIIFG
jgi:hypothetical protein